VTAGLNVMVINARLAFPRIEVSICVNGSISSRLFSPYKFVFKALDSSQESKKFEVMLCLLGNGKLNDAPGGIEDNFSNSTSTREERDCKLLSQHSQQPQDEANTLVKKKGKTTMRIAQS